MIATVFFTILLLITSAVIIGISDSYVKGQVQGITQQSSRDIMTDISQDIKFNTNSSINLGPFIFPANKFWFCIGADVYVYQYDLALSPNPTPPSESRWGLLRYTGDCPTTASPPIVSGSGHIAGVQHVTELLANNERLGYLYIPPPTQPVPNVNVYTIYLEVAYGSDNTLLNDVVLNPAHVNGTGSPPQTPGYKYACQSGSDSNFCAVSSLTEVTEPRINE